MKSYCQTFRKSFLVFREQALFKNIWNYSQVGNDPHSKIFSISQSVSLSWPPLCFLSTVHFSLLIFSFSFSLSLFLFILPPSPSPLCFFSPFLLLLLLFYHPLPPLLSSSPPLLGHCKISCPSHLAISPSPFILHPISSLISPTVHSATLLPTHNLSNTVSSNSSSSSSLHLLFLPPPPYCCIIQTECYVEWLMLSLSTSPLIALHEASLWSLTPPCKPPDCTRHTHKNASGQTVAHTLTHEFTQIHSDRCLTCELSCPTCSFFSLSTPNTSQGSSEIT